MQAGRRPAAHTVIQQKPWGTHSSFGGTGGGALGGAPTVSHVLPTPTACFPLCGEEKGGMGRWKCEDNAGAEPAIPD